MASIRRGHLFYGDNDGSSAPRAVVTEDFVEIRVQRHLRGRYR